MPSSALGYVTLIFDSRRSEPSVNSPGRNLPEVGERFPGGARK